MGHHPAPPQAVYDMAKARAEHSEMAGKLARVSSGACRSAAIFGAFCPVACPSGSVEVRVGGRSGWRYDCLSDRKCAKCHA